MSRKEPSPIIILAEGIGEDVLSQNLGHFFGPNATFSVETTKKGAQAYLIKKAGSDIAARLPAIIQALRAASRKADENESNKSYKSSWTSPTKVSSDSDSAAQSNTQSPQRLEPPSETRFPPPRRDSLVTISGHRPDKSYPLPAHSPRHAVNAPNLASRHDPQIEDSFSRMSIHKESDEAGKRRGVSTLFPKSDADDSIQQSSQGVRPPRHDSHQLISQDSASESRSVEPRVISYSGRADPQREGIDVPAQHMSRVAPNQYQSKPESQYRSPSQQRADMEARHKPEILPGRQPDRISQPLQGSQVEHDRTKLPPAVSYQSPSAYPPSQQRSDGGSKEPNDSQEDLRRRGTDNYDSKRSLPSQHVSEQEGYDSLSGRQIGHREVWQCHECGAGPHIYATTPSCTGVRSDFRQCGHRMCLKCKMDTQIPSPMGSGAFRSRESRQIAPRQPSPDTHGNQRPRQPSPDTHGNHRPRQPSPDTHGNQRPSVPSSESRKYQYAKTDRATERRRPELEETRSKYHR